MLDELEMAQPTMGDKGKGLHLQAKHFLHLSTTRQRLKLYPRVTTRQRLKLHPRVTTRQHLSLPSDGGRQRQGLVPDGNGRGCANQRLGYHPDNALVIVNQYLSYHPDNASGVANQHSRYHQDNA